MAVWFVETMDRLRQMPTPTRADLEEAASAFCRMLLKKVDQPRDFNEEHFDDDVALNIEASGNRMDELDNQLRANRFDSKVEFSAKRIARKAGGNLLELDPASQLFACQLAARAEREQMRFFVHALTRPSVPFETTFRSQSGAQWLVSPARQKERTQSPALADCIEHYLDRKRQKGVGSSTIDGIETPLRYLSEYIGANRPIADISSADLLAFCDALERTDVRKQRAPRLFPDRQTEDRDFQLNPRTAQKYWGVTAAFFKWGAPIHMGGKNPADGIDPVGRVGVPLQSPDPFSSKEVRWLLNSPLYAGHKSAHFDSQPGHVISKGSCVPACNRDPVSGVIGA
jgi:hypothetical protein